MFTCIQNLNSKGNLLWFHFSFSGGHSINYNPQVHVCSVLSRISFFLFSTYTLIWKLPSAYYLFRLLVSKNELLSKYFSSGLLKAKRTAPLSCKSFLKYKMVKYERKNKANILDLNLWEIQYQEKKKTWKKIFWPCNIPSKLYPSNICLDIINKGSPYVILKVLCFTELLHAVRKIPAGTVEQ